MILPIFFAENFAIFIPIKKANREEMIIVIIIVMRLLKDRVLRISFIAAAVPERLLLML